MFLQDSPPDTSIYMVAGYAIFFLIGTIYLISLAVRSRNLALDLVTLEEIQADAERKAQADQSAPPAPRPGKKTTSPSKGHGPKKSIKKVAPKK